MTRTEQKIPEGWSVKKLGELGTTVSGGTPDTNKKSYWEGNVSWLTPSEVTKLSNRFVYGSERKITELGLKYSSANLLPVNSLIICTRATVGECCINKIPIATNQGFKNLIPNNSNVDFLYYLLKNNKKEIIRKACGSTFLEISKKDIDSLSFFLPPLSEQRKIAEILGTWDEGIEKLSALIGLKEKQKKSLMQKILTGKSRLKGFSRPWKQMNLGDLGYTYTGLSGKNKNDFGYGCPFITYMNIFSSNIITKDKIGFVKINDKENQNQVQFGDIFFTTSSETPEEVGMSSVLLYIPKTPTYLNSFCFGFRLHDFKTIFPLFASYYFRSQYIRTKISILAQGATRFNLSKTALMRLELNIPTDLDEQKAIAEVLSTADDEINLLKQKLAALKEQKKGLMQQLLTGKVRVKVN